MSLVDYASSDEEDEAMGREEENKNKEQNHQRLPPQKSLQSNEKSSKLPAQQADRSVNHSEASTIRLPDASFLLDSPALPSNPLETYDHTSRVAAAMAQNASRKRDSQGSTASYPRGKVPRGRLPHSKNVPETVGGLLRPPQLSGRSNVVTEDINKLFTRRNADTSSGSPGES